MCAWLFWERDVVLGDCISSRVAQEHNMLCVFGSDERYAMILEAPLIIPVIPLVYLSSLFRLPF